jgi:hypothetical protein
MGRRTIIPTLLSLLFACGPCAGDVSRSNAVSISAIGGLTLPDDPVKVAMLEARAQVSSNVSTAVTLTYLEAAHGYHESQLRLSVTPGFNVGAWTIENRSMLLFSSQSFDRYRNRVRFIRPGFAGERSLSFRAFDEFYVDLDRGRFVRNNIALGFGMQIHSSLSAELYHVWVDNRGAASDNYVLATVTLRL